MISYSDLQKGTKIVFQKKPHKVIEADLMFKGRGHSTLTAKLKNLVNGGVVSKTFHPSDEFEEAEILEMESEFIYSYKGKYVFSEEKNPSNRFSFDEEQLEEKTNFLKPKQKVKALIFKEKIINIVLPVKMEFKIKEAPPGIKGGRAEAGTKQALLETGYKINVPLFIKKGDVVEVNTETGEYVRRTKKN